MDNIVFSPEELNALGDVVVDLIHRIPPISLCYFVGYSIVAVVHEFWPRYAILAYFALAALVAVFGGHR